MKFEDAVKLVQLHYEAEEDNLAPFVSPLEAYEAITKDLKNLRAQVFRKPGDRKLDSMCIEAAHLAATVLRFMTELT